MIPQGNGSDQNRCCWGSDPDSLLLLSAADQADPCRFLACGDFSSCVVNSWTKEARCLCEPGFLSEDNQPCRSVCVLQPDYCPDGECHIVPGRGAECR